MNTRAKSWIAAGVTAAACAAPTGACLASARGALALAQPVSIPGPAPRAPEPRAPEPRAPDPRAPDSTHAEAPAPRENAAPASRLSRPTHPGVTALADYEERVLAGFRVLVHPALEKADAMKTRRAVAALTHDLESLARLVPEPALSALRDIRVIVSPDLPSLGGWNARGVCFHASAEWLDGAGYGGEREGTVEVCRVDDYLLWRAEQPMVMLHEMAHAYHWLLGFERADVRTAFERARASGAYERVAHALAAPGETRGAYALTNEREYFAELSEAYFGRNDFFPFTREELREHDPEGYALVEALWSLSAGEIARRRAAAHGEEQGARPPVEPPLRERPAGQRPAGGRP